MPARIIREPAPIVSDGLRLWGEIYRPLSDRPLPGVLVCHGLPAGPPDPHDRGYAELAERWATAGFAVLIFNFRGAGTSEGDFEIAGWLRDARAAMDCLAGQSFVDPERIALVGFSAGGLTGCCLAAEDRRVAAFVGCAAPVAIRRLAEPESARAFLDQARAIGIIRQPAFPASFEEWRGQFDRVRAIDAIDRLAPRAVLIVHGERDEVVPVADARALYERAGEPRDLLLVPEAGHRLRVEPGVMDAVLEWLVRTMRRGD